jgi:serine phosphatase RsbU (regulator of sigma subunit)
VIGDVGGRGMEAAATMGQIRNSLRAYALKGAGSAEVVDDLHRLVDASAGAITFVTVVYVVLDAASGACELASAGHPPPLIAGAGRAAYVDSPRCPPLGFSGAGPCTHGSFALAPGETLWLYTDGLVESRLRPIDAGLDALADAAGRAQGELGAIADHLLVSLPVSRDDDIALLGLRRVG